VRTIAIINQKGGCGKTTCSINLAAALAQEGQRTLLVDMDPQSHCALGLAVPETQIKYSSAELMRAGLDGSLAVDDVVWQIARFFDLIPSSMALAAIEAQLQHAPDKDRRLAQVLSTCQDKYDFCIIDCPPSIGLLTFNALRAATEVVVPVETGYFSMEGAKKQHRTIEMLARRAGHNVQFSILPTMYDVRTKLAREILAEIKRHFTGHLLPQVINFNAKLKEAASFGQPITEYDATSRGMQDFEELAQHLVANPPAHPEPIEAADGQIEEEAVNPALSRAAELVERARALSQRTAEISQRLSTPATPGSLPPGNGAPASSALGNATPGNSTPGAIPARPITPTSQPEPIISPDHMFGTSSAPPAASAPNGSAESHRTAPAAPATPQQAPGSANGGAAARGADRLSGIMTAAGLKPPVAPLPSYITEVPQNTPPQSPGPQDPNTQATSISATSQAPAAAKAPRAVEDYESGFYAPAAHKQLAPQPVDPSASTAQANMPANGMIGTSSASNQSTLIPDSGLKAQIPENLDPRIADLYGVRKTSQGLLFVQPINGAATMAIAGDFNGWNPQQTKLKINEEHNVWQAIIPVPPGRYRYRLVVDGKWVKDPYNLQVESNPFGELNNVVVVKA